MDAVREELEKCFLGRDSHFENSLTEDFEALYDEGDDWIDDGKYSSIATQVKHIPSGRVFQICQDRSGSYYSDYCYNDAEVLDEVVLETQTITREVWVSIAKK